jgi:site-specific recombinase XerD
MHNKEVIQNFANYLATKGRSKTTINQYISTLNKFFFEYLKTKHYQSITKNDIDGFIQWKIDKEVIRHNQNRTGIGQGRLSTTKGELKPTSINTYLSALKKFYKYTDNIQLSESIELAKTQRWQPPVGTARKIIDYFENASYEEIKEIVKKTLLERKKEGAEIKQYYIDRDALLFFVLFSTGIRIGEASNLKISDFYYTKKMEEKEVSPTMTVKGKTGERTYSISKRVYDRIMVFVQEYNIKDYLFSNITGGALSVNSLKTYIWELFRSGLGEEFHAHDLRHAFATFLISKGENMKLVAMKLGHSSVNVTSVYVDSIKGENVDSKSPIDYMSGDKY